MLIRYYGHVGAHSGYGVAANETCMAILEAGCDLEILTDGKELGIRYQPLATCIKHESLLTTKPDVVIIHTLPLDCRKLLDSLGPFGDRTKLIAYTTWEGAFRVPRPVRDALSAFDEVWVPSSKNRACFEGRPLEAGEDDSLDVRVVPHAFLGDLSGIAERPCQQCGGHHPLQMFKPGERVSSPGGPCIVREWSQYLQPLYVRVQFEDGSRSNYDPCCLSHLPTEHPYVFYYVGAWTVRKNVEGIVRAYLRSFSPQDNVKLVIHSPGVAEATLHTTMIATGLQIEEMPGIRLSNQRLSDAELSSLHYTGDCFVSASRGEAWNLPAFDAMLAGRHIIVPAGQGSDDFLQDTSAVLYDSLYAPAGGEVRYYVPAGAPPGHAVAQYVGTQGLTVRDLWQDPDIDILSTRMQRAFLTRKSDLVVHYNPSERYGRSAIGALIKNALEQGEKA